MKNLVINTLNITRQLLLIIFIPVGGYVGSSIGSKIGAAVVPGVTGGIVIGFVIGSAVVGMVFIMIDIRDSLNKSVVSINGLLSRL